MNELNTADRVFWPPPLRSPVNNFEKTEAPLADEQLGVLSKFLGWNKAQRFRSDSIYLHGLCDE